MPRQRDNAPAGEEPVQEPDESEVDDLELDEEARGAREEPDADLPAEVDLEAEVELIEEVGVEVEVEVEVQEEEEEEEEEGVPVIRPPLRPQPGRPPSAREEPPPPFAVGERVVLVQNTRPRTGTLIGNYPVGATGRVETVLSQTAIVRFDIAPDTKEVVAFTCLASAEKGGNGKSRS